MSLRDFFTSFNKEVVQPQYEIKGDTVNKIGEIPKPTEEELLREQLYQKVLRSVDQFTVFSSSPYVNWVRNGDSTWEFKVGGKTIRSHCMYMSGHGYCKSEYFYSNIIDGIALPSDDRLYKKCQHIYSIEQEKRRVAKLRQTLTELS